MPLLNTHTHVARSVYSPFNDRQPLGTLATHEISYDFCPITLTAHFKVAKMLILSYGTRHSLFNVFITFLKHQIFTPRLLISDVFRIPAILFSHHTRRLFQIHFQNSSNLQTFQQIHQRPTEPRWRKSEESLLK